MKHKHSQLFLEKYQQVLNPCFEYTVLYNSEMTDCQNDTVFHGNVMSAIDIMVESLKRIILDASTEKLKLPMILPIESMEGITE